MTPTLNELKPFQSFLFLEDSSGAPAEPGRLKRGLSKLILAIDGTKALKWVSAAAKEGDLTTLHATYVRDKQASWTSSPAFMDRQHHLSLVSAMASLYCLYLSDGALLERVAREVDGREAEPWKSVRQVPPGRLNALFIKGRTKTLWLRGVHARSTFKADQKVLSGLNLIDALDPLGDQSYTFTAARCQSDLAGRKAAYGVAPLKSRAWFGQSKDWQAYRELVDSLLTLLSTTTEERLDPLPVLSVPTDNIDDWSQVGEVFDVGVVPNPLLNPAELQGHDQSEGGEPELEIEVVNAQPPRVTVAVRDVQSQRHGNYALKLALQPGRVLCEFESESGGDECDELLSTLRLAQDRLSIHFSRGVTASAGRLHRVRYRDLPFEGFVWSPFTTLELRNEKPDPLSPATIGNGESLFCWVVRNWRSGTLPWPCDGGWLACNDGSTELADFVHFDPVQPCLSLIHVKATKAGEKRAIAVSPFEVVVAQAIKNLRHVDPEIAGVEFINRLGKQVKEAVWKDGAPAKRLEMLAALQSAGSGIARRVLVIQPHTRRTAREKALQAAEGTRDRHLVRQLHALLLAAQHDCAALGAEFLVVGHES